MIRRTLLPMLLLAAATLPARAADSFDDQHTAAAAKSPADVTFTLSLDKPAYHLGEPIAMTLSFSTTATGKYTCDLGTYDRSGRMSEDSYFLDPADAVDPLHDYFANMGGFILGGLRQIPTLDENPRELHFDLNEWARFDHPGTHHLYASSSRLEMPTASATPIAAISNVVTFEILPPNPVWSRDQLTDIRKILDSHPKDKDLYDALRRLRFLNTSEASLELARRLDGSIENSWELQAGLMGAADRPAALLAMEQRLVAPDQPVTSSFLMTLQFLSVMQMPPAATAPSSAPATIGRRLPEAEQRRRAALQKYIAPLVASLPAKTPAARAVSVASLLRFPVDLVALSDPQLAAQLSSQFTDLFDQLPIADQIDALQRNWLRTSSPALLPHLLKLFSAPPDTTSPGLILRDWALLRAYELDPKTTRPLVLAEMANPQISDMSPLSNRMHSLLVLPDETLPDLDDDFLRLLKNGPLDVRVAAARMLARYGSKNILPQVQQLFEPQLGRWACDFQSGVLAYFLRVDPDYGQYVFAKCLASRTTGCWHELFTEVGRQVWTPELENMAIESLNNPDTAIALSAADMLKTRGAPRAADALLAALAAPYAANPDPSRLGSRPLDVQRRNSLADALLRGHHWVLTAQQIAALQSHITDRDTLAECKEELERKKVFVQLQRDFDGAILAYVDGESFYSLDDLESKIAAFSPALPITMVLPPTTDPIEQQFRTWATSHGHHFE